MAVQVQLCFLLFGTCLFSFLLLLECRKLEGYDFPVFSTKKCPGNQAEWKKRSSAINCTEQNGYMCLPNENLTDLLEFCYIYPRILVQKDLCLYLDKRFSKVDSYNCRRFKHGCPELHYFSSDTYLHQSCMEIENGCFSAEPSCKRQPFRSERSFDSTTLAINLGVSIPICLLCILALSVIGIKFGIRKRRGDRVRDDEETELLLCGYEQREPTDNNKEYPIEDAIIDQWKQDDNNFISTEACKEVEKNIRSKNLVIVAGHSGSGKSAIIQHIALKFRKQGWTVRRVKEVEDIVNIFYSSPFHKDKTVCVFNNPLGKESFDELLNDAWQRYEEDLKVYLKTAKILMSCRNYIISDSRVARYLVNQSAIVDIDNGKYKLSVDEKRQILTKYTANIDLSVEDCNVIVEGESYFPLLCKLYSSKEECMSKGIQLFTEPVTVMTEEVLGFRSKDKGKYCALILLVFFNDDLCVRDLLKNKHTENKFKHTLKLCGLPENTPSTTIENSLDSLKDCFVKMIGDRYHFYHDLVMEVTTHVFGMYHPSETIKYANIGLLRKRVRLEDCKEHTDPFTIYLNDNYIEELAERLFNELFGTRVIDVVLNPCLRNRKVIETMKNIIQKHSEKLPMLLAKKTLTFTKQKYSTAKPLHISKLAFIGLENYLSSLFLLTVFGHTDLSLECLDTLQRKCNNFKSSSLLPAVYCNGVMKLFHVISKDCDKESYMKDWGGFSPIQIVSLFHNYEMLTELINRGVNVNSVRHTGYNWTPLHLAVSNDTQEYGHENHTEQDEARRNKTLQILLSNRADINVCKEDGVSPLFIACQNGHDSTVQLLVDYGANINLCKEDRTSPLYIACQNGHDSTVQLLVDYGADINGCAEDGTSPFFIACENGHYNTVLCLLSKLNDVANINLCKNDGASPFYTACQYGHDKIVQLLLKRDANIKLCKKNGASPLYIACKNGHDSTIQHLLSNGADINLCKKNGASPLYTACKNGHDSTIKLLLSNGADINLCMKDGASPLYIACQIGHNSTVQNLLSHGADIDLCMKDGASPLYIACQNGHESTIQLLLSNGAKINLCKNNGASPLYKACQIENVSTVQNLLSNGADINKCLEDGDSPFFTACQNGCNSIVHLLLTNGADINLCMMDGASPLYIACQNGHHSTVQNLLSNGADINLCTKSDASPLYIACRNRQYSIVKLLLSHGADINLCAVDGASPLSIACQNGHDKTVKLLLSSGADINFCQNFGLSPLYIACLYKHHSIVQLLLSREANINLCIKSGASPLYIACHNGDDATVQLLLRCEANINLCRKNGASPLYIACQIGHDSTVQTLLSNGADINLCTEDGASPLYIACKNGHDSTVQNLLNSGADIDLCMKDGASPLFIACKNGHESTIQLLLSNGAKINLCKSNGASPLYIACQNGHDSTVQNLLSNGADINLCMKDGTSPLDTARQIGRESTVQLLQRNGAEIKNV